MDDEGDGDKKLLLMHLKQFPKGLVKGLENLEIRGPMKPIHTTARILRKVLETCCHSDSSERPSTNVDVKNLQGIIIIIIIIIIIVK